MLRFLNPDITKEFFRLFSSDRLNGPGVSGGGIQKPGMNAEDIYLNNIPTNLLCHSFNEGLKD